MYDIFNFAYKLSHSLQFYTRESIKTEKVRFSSSFSDFNICRIDDKRIKPHCVDLKITRQYYLDLTVSPTHIHGLK